jgi:hypothetical protein
MYPCTPAPTVAAFQFQFSRDFSYGPGLDAVRDQDIQNGFNMATAVFNPALFSTAPIGAVPNQTSESLQAFLYASAHFVVASIQAAGGLAGKGTGAKGPAQGALSQGEGIMNNKSAGGVSAGFEWPSFIKDNAALFQFSTTKYGVQYLQMLAFKLVGNVAIAGGYNDIFPGVPLSGV